MLRRAAIFFGETDDRFAGVKTRGDYSSGNSCSGKYRLAKSDERIDFDRLRLGRSWGNDKRKKAEKAVRIDFDALQMQAVKIQTELIVGLGDVDDLPHALDKQVLAIRQEDFIHKRMRLGEFLGYFSEGGADFGQPEVVDFAHSGESVTLKEVEERKANGARFRRGDDAGTLAETCEPVAESCRGHLEVSGGFRETVSGLVVDFVVNGHEANTMRW